MVPVLSSSPRQEAAAQDTNPVLKFDASLVCELHKHSEARKTEEKLDFERELRLKEGIDVQKGPRSWRRSPGDYHVKSLPAL